MIAVHESAGIYRVEVTHPCGHVFKSTTGWNDAAGAKRHGEALLACACGVCRVQSRPRRRKRIRA